jgi:hypothetical protein
MESNDDLFQLISQKSQKEKLELYEKLQKDIFGNEIVSLKGKYKFVVFSLCSGGSEIMRLLPEIYKAIDETYSDMSVRFLYVVETNFESDGEKATFKCARKRIITATEKFVIDEKEYDHIEYGFAETFVEHPEAQLVYDALDGNINDDYYCVAKVAYHCHSLFKDDLTFSLIGEEDEPEGATIQEIDLIHRALLSTEYCDNTDRIPECSSNKHTIEISGIKCDVLERWTDCESGA